MNSKERTELMTYIKDSLDFKGLSQAEYQKRFDVLFRGNLISRGVCPECNRQHDYPDGAGMCCDHLSDALHAKSEGEKNE